MAYDLKEKISYVVSRAIAEGTVPRYLAQADNGARRIEDVASDIVNREEQFFEKLDEGLEGFEYDDEYAYVSETAEYPAEISDLLLWFCECYQMMNGDVLYVGNCQKCGSDTLYIREEEGILHGSFIECGNCGEEYTYDQLAEFEGLLPLQEEEEEEEEERLPDANEITYIFRVKTGYRKSIWRDIQISAAATLEALSNAILDAFEFDDDHLYAFYMDPKGRRRDVPTFYAPACEYESANAGKQRLQDFNFAEGAKFLYLYDFGDEWEFFVTFVKSTDAVTPGAFVILSHGDAPMQYPWDEDEF